MVSGSGLIRKLEKELVHAQKQFDRAAMPVSGGDAENWLQWQNAYQQILVLERKLAAAKGEPHAVPADFPVKWDTGAPLPFLFSDDYKTFLTFYVNEPDPNWDGTYVTVVNPASENAASLALVEFHRCLSAKLGSPNDEVLSGHPLDGRGLEGYTAQIVKNSPWLEELESINKIHNRYDQKYWQCLNHYAFWFHDSTFECIAESFTVELYRETMGEMAARVANRLLRD